MLEKMIPDERQEIREGLKTDKQTNKQTQTEEGKEFDKITRKFPGKINRKRKPSEHT